MFNGKKIKELERRIELLEEGVGSRWNVFPGEDYIGIKYWGTPRVSVRTAVRGILDHLKLEYKTTLETTELVKKK